ncbi:hypothetical protein K1T71_009888 [Dendrolimus kikuchii]|uniref:Uncharacterized protein n=1 Tax=Dendrolimus kikuchii TaxID=765133 RepID=A0ACC1CT37_9NEOP|nr:hypothetical protein K1T71_009888 [Dendrolimus kikuchii]
MPLPKRCVEPVHVSRGTVPERLPVPSELEAVTNGTLANTVRQLSSLSKHAEDMFGELTREATNLAERTNVLQARIDRLAIKVTQLDSGVEEVSLQDIQMRKAFRSARTFQQQLFSRNTMPSAMLATYARCDRPPPLEKLNEFRDDGRDARKFYTDPDYFFELWRREMLQDTERIQHDRGKKVRQPRSGSGAEGRGTRRIRAPHSTRERQKEAALNRGEHIMQPNQIPHHYQENQYRQDPIYHATTVTDGGYRAVLSRQASATQPARPNSIEIENHQNNNRTRLTGNGHVVAEESPYGSVSEGIYGGSGAGTPRRARPTVPPPAPPATHAPLSPEQNLNHTPTRSTLPPPPPPPEEGSPPAMNGASPPHRTALDAHLDHMHAVIGMMSSDEPEVAVPPPPPAPLPPAPPALPPSPPAAPPADECRPRPPSPGALLRGASALKPPRPTPDPQPDPRSDLLKAIRDGIKLRKVEKRCDENTGRYDTLRGVPALHDVASILARRVAVELSDSSSAESDSDDSDQWTESRARDIEAQKAKGSPPKVGSPKKVASLPNKEPAANGVPPPKKLVSPPKRDAGTKLESKVSMPKMEASVCKKSDSPPALPPRRAESPPKTKSASPPKKENFSPPKDVISPLIKDVSTPPKKITSPPVFVLKSNRTDLKNDENHVTPKPMKKETTLNREVPVKVEKLSLVATEIDKPIDKEESKPKVEENECMNEETNGVGDKIKKFEKAAEDASAGRLSRPGSVRGRARTERIGSDGKDDLPPATPFKDNLHFDLTPAPEKIASIQERQQNLAKNSMNSISAKWQRNDGNCSDSERVRPEPQKIIKPEFKPMPSAVDVPIRSPSLGVKIPDQFPSHGTAFRNVASPDTNRTRDKFNEDVNTQNNFKTCKLKKEKYSVTKGSGYFTRGSEEIWLVKKKDIEEIEERVLDSFRRAGGNVCLRSESMRPSSDGGQSAVFTHATMGRNKRQMYARSESLDPQWAGNRAQTLKRQSSVACTCGHDKKTRAKSAGAETTPRPRSKSHGDDNNQGQGHVLDKYETLV